MRVQSRPGALEVEAITQVVAQTGVEMEALVACTGAGLSLLEEVLSEDPKPRLTTSPCGTSRAAGRATGDRQPLAALLVRELDGDVGRLDGCHRHHAGGQAQLVGASRLINDTTR